MIQLSPSIKTQHAFIIYPFLFGLVSFLHWKGVRENGWRLKRKRYENLEVLSFKDIKSSYQVLANTFLCMSYLALFLLRHLATQTLFL